MTTTQFNALKRNTYKAQINNITLYFKAWSDAKAKEQGKRLNATSVQRKLSTVRVGGKLATKYRRVLGAPV